MHGNIPAVYTPAKVYDARGNGDGKIAPTMAGDHNNRITDYTTIVIDGGGRHGAKDSQNGASEVYSTTCGYYMQVEKDRCSTLLARDYKQPQIVCYEKRE